MNRQATFAGTNQLRIDSELSTDSLDRAWNELLRALELRESRTSQFSAKIDDTVNRLRRGIASTHEKLDAILKVRAVNQSINESKWCSASSKPSATSTRRRPPR